MYKITNIKFRVSIVNTKHEDFVYRLVNSSSNSFCFIRMVFWFDFLFFLYVLPLEFCV